MTSVAIVDYGSGNLRSAAKALEDGIERGFAEKTLRPMEFGGPDGTTTYTDKLIGLLNG